MNLLSGIEQDFHRPQKNPGAYEWWHFDGADDTSGFSFSAQFHAGHLQSPFYQEKLAAYWRETKSPLLKKAAPSNAPPNPLDYPAVVFRLFRRGALVMEFLQEFDPDMLKASDKLPAVLLGSNRFNWDPAGDPPSYTVTLQGSKIGSPKSFRVRLFFTPEKMPAFPVTPSQGTPTHSWVLAAPRCHVEGTLQWCDREGDVVEESAFVGKGYHDHHFGSVPLDRFVKAWHWGRAFIGNETLIYSVQIPVGEEDVPEGIFLHSDGKSSEAWKTAFEISKKRRNFFWLPYMKSLGFSDAHQLKVEHRRILSDGPTSLIFEDRWTWIRDGQTLSGLGLSNYLYTPRLSNKFFAPMLKAKTTKISRPPGSLPTSLNQPGGDVFTDRPEL